MTDREQAAEREQLEHGRNCSERFRDDGECTCGLQWRIALQTEQTLHAAWRKRAEEAEMENERLRAELEKSSPFCQCEADWTDGTAYCQSCGKKATPALGEKGQR